MRAARRKQILFVVEGTKSEPNLILAAMKALGIETEGFAILLFRTNIHALIDVIVGEDESDANFEGVETREVLADMLEKGEGSIGEVDYHGMTEHTAGDAAWLRFASITDTFLLFDLDPQADGYRPDLLRKMQEAFVDSAGDQGRLLLSYPMIEAYKDASALAYARLCSLRARWPQSAYKNEVHDRLHTQGLGRYCDLSEYTREMFLRGMAYSVARTLCLTTSCDAAECYRKVMQGDLLELCDDADLVQLLAAQQQQYTHDQSVAVLCTALFFLTLWPSKVNHAWASCKSIGMV